MSVLRWEDPPPDARRSRGVQSRHNHDAIARTLRRHPGKWALIGQDMGAGVAHQIERGAGAYRPGGSFEAVSRIRSGIVNVYARYVGTPESAA